MAAEGMLLRFQPTAAPVTYSVTDEEVRTVQRPGKKATQRSIESRHVVARAITADSADALKVEVTPSARTLVVDGRVARGEGVATPVLSYRMSTRGERLDAADKEDPASALAPVLPEGPVKEGHTWKATLPAGKQLPFPVTVRHRYSGLNLIDGETCASILTSGDGQGVDKATGNRVGIKIRGGINLGLTSGLLVTARSFTVLTAADPKKKLGKAVVEFHRRITRLPAGAPVPAK